MVYFVIPYCARRFDKPGLEMAVFFEYVNYVNVHWHIFLRLDLSVVFTELIEKVEINMLINLLTIVIITRTGGRESIRLIKVR